MGRLTDKSEYCEWCDFDKNTCKMYKNCYERKIVSKLREYEDLEESCIEKCGGNLHMVIQKYTEFLEHMHELAEYWELEKQGLLLKLECRCKDCVHVDYAGCTGATVYCMKHEAYMNEDDFCIHAVHEKMKGEKHE